MSRWSTQHTFRVNKATSPRSVSKRSRSARTELRLEYLEERQVPAPLLLNEVSVNEPGTDNPWEYIEIKGDVSGTIAAGTYLVDFEGDGSGAGIADMVVNLSGLSLGTNGLLVVKSTTGGHTIPAATTVVTDSQLDTVGGGLENGSISFLLISSPTTAITELTDYDTNNDGTFDTLPGDASILDGVGWTDGSVGDRVYGGAALTQASGVTDAATRFANVSTASSAGAWYNSDLVGALPSAVDYDATTGSANLPSGATITPGAANSHSTAQQSSTTVAGSSINPSVYGQSITLTATVSGSSGTPTGTVEFFNGVTSLGTNTLDGGGQATLNVSVLTVGAHSVTATYGGDVSYIGSTSPAVSQTVNMATTTSGLVSSINPSSLNGAVTFTATVTPVAPGAGLPTGTVEFFDGANSLGTDTLDGSGVASLATSALTVGAHSITATFLGDTNFTTSTSAPLSQTVKVDTTTGVIVDINPSVFGQAIIITATVAGIPSGQGTPAGGVEFFDGVTSLGVSSLNGSGQATLGTAGLAVGSHSITATYAGDGTFHGSTSTPVSQTVNQSATTSGLVSSINPSSFNGSVTFTATVTPVAPGAGLPTGTVEFFDGVTSVGTDTLDGSGIASLATSALTVGAHSITATFLGDANFATSTSAPLSQTVKVDTTTGVIVDVNPSVFGQGIVFTATVTGTPSGQGTPTGGVEFFDGVTSLGVSTLNGSGQATLGTAGLAVGSHSITATYAGDGTFFGSTSSPLSQAVNKANTATVIVSSANPSLPNQLVTFTATVTAVAPGAGSPTGSVEFFDGATSLGVASLNGSGQASVSTSALTIGFHTITAAYLGDDNFNTNTSGPLTQGVKYSKSTVIPSSVGVPIPPAPGQPAPSRPRPDATTQHDLADAAWRWAWFAAMAAAELETL